MKIYLVILLFAFTVQSVAQDVITTFPDSIWVESKSERATLHQVKLTTFYTLVTIKIVPKKNKKWQRFWTSKQTYVNAGFAKLPLLGVLRKDNKFISCTYDDNLGWENVTKGQALYYTLCFAGRVPEGIRAFSLIDEATNDKGYCFRDYVINNPITHKDRDEKYCRANADQNNDGICGIYKEIGGDNYRLACVKEKEKYYLIYLGCDNPLTWWFAGDFKAILEGDSQTGFFDADWIMQNKTRNKNAYVIFDGTVMNLYMLDGNPSESSFIKIYPEATSLFAIGENYMYWKIHELFKLDILLCQKFDKYSTDENYNSVSNLFLLYSDYLI